MVARCWETDAVFICAVVANMFSVPLGIMFHADVRFSLIPILALRSTDSFIRTTVDYRGVHPQVRLLPSPSSFSLSLTEHSHIPIYFY